VFEVAALERVHFARITVCLEGNAPRTSDFDLCSAETPVVIKCATPNLVALFAEDVLRAPSSTSVGGRVRPFTSLRFLFEPRRACSVDSKKSFLFRFALNISFFGRPPCWQYMVLLLVPRADNCALP